MTIQSWNNEVFACENLVDDEDPEYEPSSLLMSDLNKACEVIEVTTLKVQKLKKKRTGCCKEKIT